MQVPQRMLNPASSPRLKMRRRLLVTALIVTFCAAYYFRTYFTLEFIKSNEQTLIELSANHWPLSAVVFFLIYFILTAISFPGASAMGVLSGVLFGFWRGTALVSMASTFGSAAAFLIARNLGRAWVEQRYKERMCTFHAGIRREGGLYLLALRLNPVVPFFLINIVMGLTPISLATFFWLSLIGMLPGTMLFVNAGTRLKDIQSLSDILTWPVALSLVALGVFPLLMKRTFKRFSPIKV